MLRWLHTWRVVFSVSTGMMAILQNPAVREAAPVCPRRNQKNKILTVMEKYQKLPTCLTFQIYKRWAFEVKSIVFFAGSLSAIGRSDFSRRERTATLAAVSPNLKQNSRTYNHVEVLYLGIILRVHRLGVSVWIS